MQDENRKVHTVYGIEAVGANGEIIQGYPDVFSDRQKAEHFAGVQRMRIVAFSFFRSCGGRFNGEKIICSGKTRIYPNQNGVTGFECGDIVHTYYDDAAQMRDHYIEHGGSAAVQGQSQPSSC